jgi:hypothetical protein
MLPKVGWISAGLRDLLKRRCSGLTEGEGEGMSLQTNAKAGGLQLRANWEREGRSQRGIGP